MSDYRNISVNRNDDSHRYEMTIDGEDAGYVAFEESDTHIAFTHTEVREAFQGKGVGSHLAGEAIADAVARDLTIIPLCPYMARYLERHDVEGARVEWPNRPPRQ